MKRFEDYDVLVSHALAEKLYRLGFQVGTPQCITRYDSDFVYDGDPEHPESHKAGEVHLYDFWHKNNNEENNLFECPTIEMLAAWLLDTYQIHVAPSPHVIPGESWQWSFVIMSMTKIGTDDKQDKLFDSLPEAWMAGAETVVDVLLALKDEKDIHPEQFF